MPFKSQAQRRYLYARHPGIAREFEAHTPKGSHLPQHVSKKHRRVLRKLRKNKGGKG